MNPLPYIAFLLLLITCPSFVLEMLEWWPFTLTVALVGAAIYLF